MCSFIFLRSLAAVSDASLFESNRFSRHRGPDFTNVVRAVAPDGRHLTFLHNLLDISGEGCRQPVAAGPPGECVWALFNGEIYNFLSIADVRCDTECIIPGFHSAGDDLGRMLDGEFATVVFSEADNSVSIFTDPFLTKPLYLGGLHSGGDFGAATCESSLRSLGFTDTELAEPNTSYRIDFNGDKVRLSKTFPAWPFEPRQYKQSYDDWNAAFLEAVRKRATHGSQRPSVYLSSGYDSGAICLALNLLGLEYDTFSIVAGEQAPILDARIRINRSATCRSAYRYRGVHPVEMKRLAADIVANAEPVRYVHEDSPGVVTSLHDDMGALGGNFVAQQARKCGSVVNLSGSGADEIISDYGHAGKKHYHHSEFGGLFPEDLESMFPWKKFYGDTQRSYLLKEEFILGRHGVEGRYPFLDRRLVQEFLWLAPALKNAAYKAPIAQFLERHSYPFEKDVKRGFEPRGDHWSLRRFLARLLTVL